MESSLRPPRTKPGGRRIWFLLLSLLVISLLLAWGCWLLWPNSQHETPSFNGLTKPVFYRGELLERSALGEKEGLKLPYAFIKEKIDPTIRYEEPSQSVIITTEDKVVRLRTSQLTALVNEKPFQIRFAVEQKGESLYLPVDPLKEYYSFVIHESNQTNLVTVNKGGDSVQWGKTPASSKGKTRALRAEPTVKAVIYADLPPEEEVMIWGEENGWYHVQQKDGYTGYVRKSELILSRIETIPNPVKEKEHLPWKPTGSRINLTWQQVTAAKAVDTTKIGPMPGLNVISPQWFHLLDGEGNLQNLADPAYLKWAHDRGYQVWALFSNGFEPKRTAEALSTYDRRMKMIKQLLAYAEMYSLQGINIDFENIYLKEKENLVQFVREMVPLLHEQNLVVSIDVAVKDGSEMYSRFMDRRAVGEVVDYMMVMTYDEHWATSPKAGSVASLPWVEKGIVQIIKEDAVPSSKLLLGMPFYTRIWTEQPKDGKTAVTSKAVSMEAVQKIIEEKKLTPAWDEEAGQNYVQYTEDDKTVKIWIEDAVSVKSRVDLAKKLDLAGVASWSRTFETPDIWTVIQETLEKRP